MPVNQSVQRIFNMDDNDVLVRAQLFYDNFSIDEAEITAVYPTLDTPFADNFQTAINDADNLPSDQEEVDFISYKVSLVNERVAEAKVLIQQCYNFVKLAFGDNIAINKNFGKGPEYHDAANSGYKIKELLEKVHRACDRPEFKPQLIAVGFTQLKIDALEDKMTELDSVFREAEEAKSQRLMKTYARIEAFNSVWSMMIQISDAVKDVFRDNPNKLHQYLLYPSSSGPSVPSKTHNLRFENDRFIWNVVANSETYFFETKPHNESNWVPVAETINNYYIMAPLIGNNDYRVRATNEQGNGAWSDVLTLNIAGMGQVTGLVVNFENNPPPTPSRLVVSWNNPSGATMTELWYAEAPGSYNNPPPSNFSKIFDDFGEEFIFNNPESYPNMKYFYAIAKNGPNIGPQSDIAWFNMNFEPA